MAHKTIRRDWLKKQIEAGKVEAKCNFHYTDDYAFDNAYGFGKTEWMPAHIMHPTFERRTNYVGNPVDVCVNDDRREGHLNFLQCQFSSTPNVCYWQDDGTIRFGWHSNESYTLRIKQA